MTFTLKCVLCGHIEQRDSATIPKDGPACPKCFGPMIPTQVATTQRVQP